MISSKDSEMNGIMKQGCLMTSLCKLRNIGFNTFHFKNKQLVSWYLNLIVATFQVISLIDKSSEGPQRNMITWLSFSLSQLSNLLLIIITTAKVVLIQTISLWTFSSSWFVNKSKYFGRIDCHGMGKALHDWISS